MASLTKQASLPTSDDRIVSMVRRILGRTPTTMEIDRAKGFLENDANPSNTEGPLEDPEQKWIQLAHAFMASNEFFFLD